MLQYFFFLYWNLGRKLKFLFSLQGSRDNMSVVLVCLPNAPKVSEEAVKRDAELDKFLETRVEGERIIETFLLT